MIERTRYGPDGRVLKHEVVDDRDVGDEVAMLAHVVNVESVAIKRRDQGGRVEYRRVEGLSGTVEMDAAEEAAPAGDRIGAAIAVLAEVRTTLYGSKAEDRLQALREAPSRIAMAEDKLTRLWVELVGLEVLLVPATTDEEVDARA